MSSSIIVILLLTLGVVEGHFDDCSGKFGKLLNLTIENCPDIDKSCILTLNKTVTISAEFSPAIEVQNITHVVRIIQGLKPPFSYVKAYKLSTPVALFNPSPCSDGNLKCPLAAGETYVTNAQFVSMKFRRFITLGLKWLMRNEKGEDIICGMIHFEIE